MIIILLPLLGFIYAFLFGFILGRQGGYIMSTLAVMTALGFSIMAFRDYCLWPSSSEVLLVDWVVTSKIKLQLGFLFDGITLIMCIVVTLISVCVLLYSIGYMYADPHKQLFTAYLSLFTFFMLILVTADNLIFMYFGWEGVGVMSYLLINFWDTRSAANKAALKAMIVNRISDVFFFIGIILLLLTYGTVNFVELTVIVNSIEAPIYETVWFNWLNFICIFLLFGVFGKSAQIIFHVWLPDAMEGPTPVSALLHAATMVTAGIILLMRCAVIMIYCPSILQIVTIFGSITACMAAFASIFQMDIKKVIAYSTCSQLGYMVMACGLSYYNVALFHLFNHAFFKALLFLGAGSIIHAVADEQDMRRMGGLINFLPFTFFCMVIGSIAIMGIPFLSGFYSKDLIIELTYNSYYINAILFYFLAVFAAFCTALYSIRLILFVFFFKPKTYHIVAPKEADNYMTISLITLFVLSILVGYIFSDLFVGLGSNLLCDTIIYLPLNYYYTNQFLVSPFIKNFPLIMSVLGTTIGMLIILFINQSYKTNSKLYYIILRLSHIISAFSYHALYFNIVYNDWFVNSYKYSYNVNTKLMDKGLYEYFGPVGFYRFFYILSEQIRNLSPSIFLSLGFMFSGLVLIYCYLILSLNITPYYVYNFGIYVSLSLIIYNEFRKQNLLK
jgi:NADH-ubiquinone oxidoreductase chain 5